MKNLKTKFNTQQPEYTVEELFPFLQGLGKSAWRLHPRRQRDLPLEISKFGGSIRFPANKPLPCDKYTETFAVPVLQLRRQDFLNFDFFNGAGYLQVLWQLDDIPQPIVYWHTEAELENSIILNANTVEHDDTMSLVQECKIFPEEIIEYPYIDSLTAEQQKVIRDWEAQISSSDFLYPEPIYQYRLSTCPGSKIGGYPQWGGQDAKIPQTTTRIDAQYCLTLADSEWDGGSWQRWRPQEQISPPDGKKHLILYTDGRSTETRLYTPEEQQILDQWDQERYNAYADEQGAIGTYLKSPINIFFDQTITPWTVLST
jgi:hypothetical protein